MAALQCEICGGKLIGKPGGVFECDSCGMEYSTKWAKAKVQEIKGTVKIEGPVEVTGTVKVDDKLGAKNLIDRGMEVLAEADATNIFDEKFKARKYFNQALDINIKSAEAYLGLALVTWHLNSLEELERYCSEEILQDANIQKAQQFADTELKEWFAKVEQLMLKRKEDSIRLIPKLAEQRKRIAPAAGLISFNKTCVIKIQIDGTAVLYATDESNTFDNFKVVQSVVKKWQNLIAVATGDHHIVGLKSDGTVVATGKNENGQCNVGSWMSIVAIAAGNQHTVGLKSDGTVVAVGSNSDGQCDVGSWTDIVAVTAGYFYTVGLKSDGTVVATGKNENGQCSVGGWTDIVAVNAGSDHTIGIKSDGTVVATGDSYKDWCKVQKWKLFNSVDTLEQERVDAETRQDVTRQQKIAELNAQKQTLQTEIANCKGLFSGGKRKELEAKLAQVEKELSTL